MHLCHSKWSYQRSSQLELSRQYTKHSKPLERYNAQEARESRVERVYHEDFHFKIHYTPAVVIGLDALRSRSRLLSEGGGLRSLTDNLLNVTSPRQYGTQWKMESRHSQSIECSRPITIAASY